MMKWGACANVKQCGTKYDTVFKATRSKPWLCALCSVQVAIAERERAAGSQRNPPRSLARLLLLRRQAQMETPDYVVPILVMGFRCLRCSHEWVPRGGSFADEPKTCPKCKSPYWNRHRKFPVSSHPGQFGKHAAVSVRGSEPKKDGNDG